MLGTAFDMTCGCTCFISRVIPMVDFFNSSKNGEVVLEFALVDFCQKQHMAAMMSDKFYMNVNDFNGAIKASYGDPKLKPNATKTMEYKAMLKGYE